MAQSGGHPGGQDDRSDRRGHHRTSAMLGDVNWIAVASASILAGVLSILTSVAGLPEVNNVNG